MAVAQETRLAVRSLEFKGKDWQNVRTALNRAEKTGVRAVWGRYADFAPAVRAQLSEVSEEWAAQKSVPEMGFTLGGIDELEDPEVLCCVAVDAEGAGPGRHQLAAGVHGRAPRELDAGRHAPAR